jgi:Ca2+-binding EF-hand superfamily protein
LRHARNHGPVPRGTIAGTFVLDIGFKPVHDPYKTGNSILPILKEETFTMRIAKVVFLTAIIFTAAGIAHSEDAVKPRKNPNRPADMQKADTNKDGKISFEELQTLRPNATKEQFQKLDKDHDGFLTQTDRKAGADDARKILKEADKNGDMKVSFEELKAVRPQVTAERFAVLDRNGDGVIDPSDKPEGTPGVSEGRERYKKADSNNDGKISFEEITADRPKVTKEIFSKWDSDSDGFLTPGELAKIGGGKRDKAAGGMARVGQGAALDKLLTSDSNGDGNVTFEEVTATKPGYPREAFNRFDQNKDGQLTKADAPPSN